MGKLQNMMRVMRKHDIEDSKLVDIVLDMDDGTCPHGCNSWLIELSLI